MVIASAPQVARMTAGEVRTASCSVAEMLSSGEAVNGTPTLTASTVYVSTIGSITISATAMTILGSSVAAGQAITFLVTATTSVGRVELFLTATTNSGQTIKGRLPLVVMAST